MKWRLLFLSRRLNRAFNQQHQSCETSMSVVIILILASLAVGLVFVGAFVWSVRSGQYEDTLTPSMRMLHDDAATQIHSQPAGDLKEQDKI
jgi:cbb3-type cytochrome oxidase maturation protein